MGPRRSDEASSLPRRNVDFARDKVQDDVHDVRRQSSIQQGRPGLPRASVEAVPDRATDHARRVPPAYEFLSHDENITGIDDPRVESEPEFDQIRDAPHSPCKRRGQNGRCPRRRPRRAQADPYPAGTPGPAARGGRGSSGPRDRSRTPRRSGKRAPRVRHEDRSDQRSRRRKTARAPPNTPHTSFAEKTSRTTSRYSAGIRGRAGTRDTRRSRLAKRICTFANYRTGNRARARTRGNRISRSTPPFRKSRRPTGSRVRGRTGDIPGARRGRRTPHVRWSHQHPCSRANRRSSRRP